MASAEQIKALLKSHIDGEDDRFFSVAMQVAAHEARLGHGKLAEELRAMIDDAKGRRGADPPVPIGRPRGELANLLEASYPKARLGEMILNDALAEQIRRVIREQRHAGRIVEHGLSPRRKLLLTGPPGTGKTMTASVLAGELGIPLFQVRLDGLITKYMGETAAKLRQIFDATSRTRGVYFFDEFDAIGSHRGIANDVGEIRRVLNSFLQMIEQDHSHSLVVGATNHPAILDSALTDEHHLEVGRVVCSEDPSDIMFRRHPALRASGQVAGRQSPEGSSLGFRRKGDSVAEPGRLGDGIELRGDHARIQRGAQGCANP